MSSNGKMAREQGPREQWGGSLGFVLAAAGSAVGLGNIWRFPYITGENGGGAFVLVYLICVLLIGLPIMICEISLGRYAQRDPVGSFAKIAPGPTIGTRMLAMILFLAGVLMLVFARVGLGLVFLAASISFFFHGWRTVGYLCILTPFVILAYYGTVGGWTITYFFKGLFQGLNFSTPEEAAATFRQVADTPSIAVTAQVGFMLLCGLTVRFGVRNGIELVSKFLLPLLFLLLIILIVRSVTLPNASGGVNFLLSPDFSKLSTGGVLLAMGHAFYSLSIGMGALITYGSYLDSKKNIFANSLMIVILDTVVASRAGLAIFPAVFSVGMPIDQGPNLVFQIMPLIFNSIGSHFGWFWSSVFFLLLAIAALTSGISLLEVMVCCLVDHFRMKRHSATFWATLTITAVGVLCTISHNDWSRLEILRQWITQLFGGARGSMFDLADKISSSYMLPICGLGISLFVGWVWGTSAAVRELRRGAGPLPDVNFFALLAGLKDDPIAQAGTHSFTLGMIWGIFVRFIAPIGIVIVFLHSIGWLDIGL